MRYPLLGALVLASSAAHAEPIYLKCDLLAAPDYQQFLSQSQKDAFLTDVVMRGLIGYVVPPSETWIIDLESGQIRTPEEDDDRFVVRNLKITEGRIRGTTQSGSIFDLNRVSLRLSYTKFLDEKGVNLQGIAVPTSSTWSFQCTASKAPAV